MCAVQKHHMATTELRDLPPSLPACSHPPQDVFSTCSRRTFDSTPGAARLQQMCTASGGLSVDPYLTMTFFPTPTATASVPVVLGEMLVRGGGAGTAGVAKTLMCSTWRGPGGGGGVGRGVGWGVGGMGNLAMLLSDYLTTADNPLPPDTPSTWTPWTAR